MQDQTSASAIAELREYSKDLFTLDNRYFLCESIFQLFPKVPKDGKQYKITVSKKRVRGSKRFYFLYRLRTCPDYFWGRKENNLHGTLYWPMGELIKKVAPEWDNGNNVFALWITFEKIA